MRIPATLTAGDSATWLDTAFGDPLGRSVDSSSYALTYSLRGPVAAARIDLAGTPSGTGWQFSLSTVQTAALNTLPKPAQWYWAAYASRTGERITAGEGTLYVRPNLAGIGDAVAFDGRSRAEQVLAAIEAEIEARISGGATVEYTIDSRSLKKEPMSELMALRSRYTLMVSRERRKQQIANGLGNPQRLGVRFK